MADSTEIPVFEYYGLVLLFLREDAEPIHVYCDFNGKRALAHIQFVNGLYKGTRFDSVENYDFPDKSDIDQFSKLIDEYIPELLRLWQEVFIYHRQVKKELINKKI